jgi:hypothetical protein
MVKHRYTALALSVPLLAACGALISIPDAQLIADDQLRPDGSVPPGADSSTGSDGGTGEDSSIPTCNADLQTDLQNCGACNHDCSNGICAGGVCTLSKAPTTTQLRGAYGLHVNRDTVYVAEGGWGAITSCATNGCDVPTRLDTYDRNTITPFSITGDDQFIYWGSPYASQTPGSGMFRTPHGSGATTPLTAKNAFTRPGDEVTAIALGTSGLFFGTIDQGPYLIRAPNASGTGPFTVQPVVTGPSPNQNSSVLVAHAAGLYWIDSGDVYYCGSIPCSAPELILPANGTFPFLATDSQYLYVLDYFQRVLSRCAHTIPHNCAPFWQGLPPARALAVKDGTIYIGARNEELDGGLKETSSIVSCSTSATKCESGMNVKTLATFTGLVRAMFVDQKSVYWVKVDAESNSLNARGNIMKAPR